MMGQIKYADADLDWGKDGEYIAPTLASRDRLWTVVLFEDNAPPEWPEYQHSMLFFLESGALSYELEDDTLFWTSFREARAAQRQLQAEMDERAEARGFESPTLYLLNWGDHAREENRILGRTGDRRAPRKASVPALTEWRRRWALMFPDRREGK